MGVGPEPLADMSDRVDCAKLRGRLPKMDEDTLLFFASAAPDNKLLLY
jgi:hypothetical protein